MKRIVLLLSAFYFLLSTVKAQYAPQAGVAGSTAIPASSSLFVGWATSCQLHRGYRCVDTPSLGYATVGDSSSALGPVDHNVVSLGDSGVATVKFSSAIFNGPGPDFAVFENGFPDPSDAEQAFLELAFVEVSSDGINYFRFAANSLTQDTTQIRVAGDYMDARNLNNLAGKYIVNYGTPFDLQELSGIPGLDINNITHVRIIDVIGSIGSHATHDSVGRKINDPYPTAIASSGFDLDAVGAIHLKNAGVNNVQNNVEVSIYPNPTADKLIVSVKQNGSYAATLTDITGQTLQQQILMQGENEIYMARYSAGLYYLILQDGKGNKWVEKITKL